MGEYGSNDKEAVREFRRGYLEGSRHSNMQDIAAKLVQMAKEVLGEDDEQKKRKNRR
jgi:hypothetical protein